MKTKSICYECEWLYNLNDENGMIDYCMRTNVYEDELEKVINCLYFREDDVERRLK